MQTRIWQLREVAAQYGLPILRQMCENWLMYTSMRSLAKLTADKDKDKEKEREAEREREKEKERDKRGRAKTEKHQPTHIPHPTSPSAFVSSHTTPPVPQGITPRLSSLPQYLQNVLEKR